MADVATPGKTSPLILVVDDHDDSRAMLVMLLESGQFRATGAPGAAAALALIERETPAVIITDISMPTIDGWTFIDRLKASDHTNTIPVIVLTGHTGDAAMLKALAAGSTFFPKPFMPDALLGEVSYLVYQDRTRDRRAVER